MAGGVGKSQYIHTDDPVQTSLIEDITMNFYDEIFNQVRWLNSNDANNDKTKSNFNRQNEH